MIPEEVIRIADDIKSMRIRGAGRIARAAADALMIAAKSYRGDLDGFVRYMEKISKILLSTRPTAVSLPNAISYVMKATRRRYRSVEEAIEAVVRAAIEFKEYSERALELIGEIGSKMIEDGMVIMTHCNSSAVTSILARAWGEGKRFRVYATETRPRYQGYITARDLASKGIPTTLITDSAVAYIMRKADLVLVGADAIASNGALINKIGTSQVALAAKVYGVPFYVAAETYKFSPYTLAGEAVEIEERDPREILDPPIDGVEIRNPVFDATPPEYIDAIITEIGVISPEMAILVITDFLGHRISAEEPKGYEDSEIEYKKESD
ncbi:MAG: ribose 1,5-bisphosphate isomerase [Sulfolobales archaeon]